MPGLTISLGSFASEQISREVPNFLKLFDKRYFRETFVSQQGCNLFVDRYPQYPVKRLEIEDGYVIVEGLLMDRSDDELREIALQTVAQIRAGQSATKLGEWLAKTDGDFVVCLVDRVGGIILLANDRLGRLPTYLIEKNGGCIISREIGNLLELSGTTELDALACAEMVAYRWPLGNRTVYKNVFVLEPGSVVGGSIGEVSSLSFYRYYRANYDERVAVPSAARAFDDLAELFLNAVRKRIALRPDKGSIVGLSGGMDCRLIVASLKASDKPFQAVSFKYKDRGRNVDWAVAKQLADRLGGSWKKYDVDDTDEHFSEKLLQLKRGMNYVGVGFLIRFLDEIANDLGYEYDYWTGDGGNRPLLEPSTMIVIKQFEHLYKTILSEYNPSAFRSIEEIFGIRSGEIAHSLEAHLDSLPERDMNNRFDGFIIDQRMRRWLFEGEDRNRYYFWQQSPLFDLSFFDYSMHLGSRLKRDKRLYCALITKLNEDAADVLYNGFNLPISHPLFPIKARLSRSPTVRKVRGWMAKSAEPLPEGELDQTQKLSLLTIQMLQR